MVKGVGLDPGEFEVKVVEIDGSYRKPKLTNVSVDRVSQLTTSAADPDHASNEALALQHAVKSAKIGVQNICLGFSSREALFRQLQVPFTGEERIRKVIKFEAESEIHSQSVDDMVIDFHVVEEVEDETRVLVAGVPKQPLRTTLGALERVGIEPERVDLDCMGLYRVADWSGALNADTAEVEGEGTDAIAELGVGPRSRVVLNVGARAVLILVVTDGHLLDMRAVPLGCDSLAEDLAAKYSIDLEQARDAMIYCLTTGEDYDSPRGMVVGGFDEGEEDAAENGEGESDDADDNDSSLMAQGPVVPAAAVEEARDRFLGRLRRELMRFVVSVKGIGQIDAVYTTGAGSLMSGMDALLTDVFGPEPQPLSYMHLLQHGLNEEEAEYMEPRISVALGLALGHMNGVKGFNFRQEDLVYTRGFDRIKLPLAIACMLGLFFLFFHGVGLRKQLQAKERLYGFAVPRQAKASSSRREKGTRVTQYMQFTGRLTHLVNEGTWPERTLPHNEYRKMVNLLAEQPTFERIGWYERWLKAQLKKVQKQGQYEPSLALDSGAAVLQQFANLIGSIEKSLGRFYVGQIEVRLPAKTDGRMLEFEMFFRGDTFRDSNLVLKRALEESFKDQESAFLDFDKPETETPVKIDMVGGRYKYYVLLKPSIPVMKL